VWLLAICAFALAHCLHLRADFPNHSPWMMDWAKYTDEGWYGNAAVRAHLFGHWYLPGDFNPAPAVPVWPILEWILFCLTGVKIEAARALAVSFFLLDLYLGYLLLRVRGSRWMALFAVTLAVTSPFLYAFSRLAILEPMLIALLLAGLNLAARLPRFRSPLKASAAIGLLFTLMLLTKTSGVFLLPALGWPIAVSLWPDWRKALRCAIVAASTSALTFCAWMALVIHAGLLSDYRYLFFVNKYEKPSVIYWPLFSFWWSFHGGLWADRALIPLAGIAFLIVVLAWKAAWSRALFRDPVFGSSVLAVAGYILFMTYQNHPQARYFTVIGFFSFLLLPMIVEALLVAGTYKQRWTKLCGAGLLAAACLVALFNGAWTLEYALHPEYTFVDAAWRLTRYIETHPNGNPLLVSISGDEITMITHLPSLCDDFGTEELVQKLDHYQPGWWATWNDIDPGTLEDLHVHHSLEQVASFRAFDDPDRNVLVLFKLHPLPVGEVREGGPELQVPLPGDRIQIPIQ
jgi:4-amino-4-deoxy-L-arabinose transferase-like glycosyltransferase